MPKSKGCSCLEEVRTALEKERGRVEFPDVLTSLISRKSGASLRYDYSPKNADGSFHAKMRKHGRIFFRFCPFCGKSVE